MTSKLHGSQNLFPPNTNKRKPLPGQSKLQMCCALRDRRPCGGSEKLQLACALQLFVLFLGRRLGGAHLFPYREGVAVTKINAEVFEQSVSGFCGQPAEKQIDRDGGSRKVIVVVIPDKDFRFLCLSRGNHADVRLSADAIADNVLGTQGT